MPQKFLLIDLYILDPVSSVAQLSQKTKIKAKINKDPPITQEKKKTKQFNEAFQVPSQVSINSNILRDLYRTEYGFEGVRQNAIGIQNPSENDKLVRSSRVNQGV